MSVEDKYSLKNLKQDFPTEKACLDFLFDTLCEKKCKCGGRFTLTKIWKSETEWKYGKKYQCSRCRKKVSPTAGTIFHKSSTPLSLWFHAIFIFCNAKSGISAKEMERQLGVTYKCAYRILCQIRQALPQMGKIGGTVEADMAYFGKVKRHGGTFTHEDKTFVQGAVSRDGEVRAQVSPSLGRRSSDRFLMKYVDRKSLLITDGASAYKNAPFKRKWVNHSRGFARGKIHINTIEAFWAHVKRSTSGTFKGVSPEKFQQYLDAYAFHWNHRHDRKRFSALLDTLLQS